MDQCCIRILFLLPNGIVFGLLSNSEVVSQRCRMPLTYSLASCQPLVFLHISPPRKYFFPWSRPYTYYLYFFAANESSSRRLFHFVPGFARSGCCAWSCAFRRSWTVTVSHPISPFWRKVIMTLGCSQILCAHATEPWNHISFKHSIKHITSIIHSTSFSIHSYNKIID